MALLPQCGRDGPAPSASFVPVYLPVESSQMSVCFFLSRPATVHRLCLEHSYNCAAEDLTVTPSSFPQVVVEAARKTAAMAQAAPLRNGRETKVLLTTGEKGTNLIGSKPTCCFDSNFYFVFVSLRLTCPSFII